MMFGLIKEAVWVSPDSLFKNGPKIELKHYFFAAGIISIITALL